MKLLEYLDPKVLTENGILFAVIMIFMVMYGPRLAPRLPETVRRLFDSGFFRGVIFFMILYISSKDARTALVITIVFMVGMNVLQTMEFKENFVERFSTIQYGPPVANCSTYPKNQGKALGNYYYPLNDTNESAKLREQEMVMPYGSEEEYRETALISEPMELGYGN